MDASTWGAVGVIAAAILTLAGVIYSGRFRPEASMLSLSTVVKTQGAEIGRQATLIIKLEKKVEVLTEKLDALEDVAEEKARWQAVAELLYKQIDNTPNMRPVVPLPEIRKKPGTGPLGAKGN